MPHADPIPRGPHARTWQTLAVVLCAWFLAWVAGFYHPGLGFSALVIIPQGHDYEIPALQKVPHYEYHPGEAYDGAMYAQIAMEPLLRNPAIDRALDNPPYRARRILFCWTAYALGLGRPAWILQAYALQNVLCWLVLAWFITRWLPPNHPSGFALWAAAMFSQGLLISVRMALLDGPSLLLLACAVAAAERGQTLLTGAIAGLAGLGRETNVLGAVLLPWPRDWLGRLRTALGLILVVLPLLVWQDYVHSIYWSTSPAAGADQIVLPFAAFIKKWVITVGATKLYGYTSAAGPTLLTLTALTVQAIFVVWTRAWSEPWWRLAAIYAILMALVDWAVWEGYPGAITRVVLPLTFGFNILLGKVRPRAFWIWFVLGNLDLVASMQQLRELSFL